ncbi:hypothetical protein [Kribbella solani]|uniref:Uncharacterized protein n=1 Tax=Kribbella solani TaxID=236067 RepID=A0A841DPA4_9ACTN|nr:hypothetical protein [Kribbella solani]MBB5979639.1 hypothetical protein [Kribbella solani]
MAGDAVGGVASGDGVQGDVDSRDWWDHRPVFSTVDKGGRITGLAPSERPGRLTGRLLISSALCFIGWGIASLLGTSLLCGGTSAPAGSCAVDVPGDVPVVWAIVAAVVGGYLTLFVTTDVTEQARQRFGQRRAASFLRSAPLLAGLFAGAAISVVTALRIDTAETIRRTTQGLIGTEAIAISAALAVLAGLWWVAVMLRLPGALLHAYQRQTTIDRLRRDGRRYGGQVRLGDIVYWLGNNPELNVTIEYDSPAGHHQRRARMRTSPDRVPTDGSRVIVYDDLRGDVHVELDRAAGPVWAPEARYTPSE